MPGQIAAAYVAVDANRLCTEATAMWFGGRNFLGSNDREWSLGGRRVVRSPDANRAGVRRSPASRC
jgi:hypothetical protein